MRNLIKILAFILVLVSAITLSISKNKNHTETTFSYVDQILGGMNCVIIQHSIADFDTWNTAYKKDKKRRKKSGIKEKLLLRGADDPNFITVVFELNNIESAQTFFADPHSAELMEAAGVISKPSFRYFKVGSSGIPEGDYFLLVQHTVKDYNFWKQEFDKHKNVRSEYHMSLTALGKDLENPLNVVAIFNSIKLDNITSFLEKSDLKEAMKHAGITSAPTQDIMVLNK